MSPRATKRRNVKRTASGKVIRLPDVPGVHLERPHWDAGRVVAGIDEVGRGPWAGPVTYAVCVLPPDRRIYKLRDSKMLSRAAREGLVGKIHEVALDWGVGHASNDDIDRLGMSDAIRLAAGRAMAELQSAPDVVLLDGNWDFLDDYPAERELVVYGDATSASIAAASIIAKTTRDDLMREAHETYPQYNFASNKGYPSPEHRAALAEHGPCPLHRHSWAPIRELTTPQLFQVDAAT